MLVSFIIPFYKSELYIGETIQSVLDCGYPKVEICLINDGSIDGSQVICNQYKDRFPDNITILQHESGLNKGVSASRGIGVEAARGDVIFFLDSDDVLLPGIVGKYVDIFQRSVDIVMIHGKIKLIGTTSSHVDIEKEFDLGSKDKKYLLSEEPYFLRENHICNSTACFRKESVTNLDFSYQQAFQVEDWVLWTLLSERGMFYYVPEPVTKYRYHETSATHEVNRKGHMYYIFTRVELYMVLVARMSDIKIKRKVSHLLYENLNMLYGTYSKNSRQRFAFRLPILSFTKDYIKSLINRK
jgi:glycosyltransferase involved in cell wall biosynthesis